jgi:hypothetical protein
MLAVIRGELPDGIVVVPRLDIWYNHNKARGTLPVGYETLSLRETAGRLGVGFHSVIPDFIRNAPIESIYHRGLGFYNNPDFPYTVDFSEIDFEVSVSENELKVTYHTSKGEITTRCEYGPEFFKSGSSIPGIKEHAVKGEGDYRKLVEIFSQINIHPAPENYRRYYDRVGVDGVAVAFLSLACGPMQHIMRDLRRYEDFCFDLYDRPDILAQCEDSLIPVYEKILNSITHSSAEVFLFGANYDETITYRPFFEKFIAPWLNKAKDIGDRTGKYLLTHTDGENQGLLPAFEMCRFDIADSICPSPMTKVSFRDYRKFFGKKTTIWGGIPSIMVLKNSYSYDEFKDFVSMVIKECPPYDHLIISIADTTPPDADFDRIRYLIEACTNA